MKNTNQNKNFVKLTEDQSLLLDNIDQQLQALRKKNLSALKNFRSQVPPVPDISDALAASIYLYQQASEKTSF